MAQIEQGISKKYKNPSNKLMPDRVHKKTENNWWNKFWDKIQYFMNDIKFLSQPFASNQSFSPSKL